MKAAVYSRYGPPDAGFIYLLTIVTANFLPPLLLPRRMHRLAN